MCLVRVKSGKSPCGVGVESSPLFSGILQGDYARISAAARIKEFVRDEMLYFKGDSVQHVFLLTSGVVKSTQLGVTGTEVILRLSVPGDVLGAVGHVSSGRHNATAQVFRACSVLVWDAHTFKSLTEQYPVLYQNLVRILGEDLLELGERFHEVATERVGPRVARQLVRLRQQIGRSVNGSIEVALSREELAQMTGTTLFTVSRLLSAWEARGIVEARREAVAIQNVHRLCAICAEG